GVEDGAALAPGRGGGGRGGGGRDVDAAQPLLPGGTPCRPPPRPQGDPVGDRVQPAAHRLALADGAGPPHQRQERRLEGVVHVPGVAEDAAADAQHHRAVPPDEQLEGGLVAVPHEARQKLRVGDGANVRRRDRLAKLPEGVVGLLGCHGLPSGAPSTVIESAREYRLPTFFRDVSAPAGKCREPSGTGAESGSARRTYPTAPRPRLTRPVDRRGG